MVDSIRIWSWVARTIGVLILLFLLLPLFAIIPLAFNAGSIVAYPMTGVSTRWFQAVAETPRWATAVGNSLIVGVATVVISTPLGTLAALGLDRLRFWGKSMLMALLISPMIVPIIITAVGIYFFFAPLGLANNLWGLILAHSAIAVPYVLVSVSAVATQRNKGLERAASSLGASPLVVFRRVTIPMIAPGIISGAIFAFATSFDEVVIAMMITGPDQRTLPRELLSGTRENLDPGILAVGTIIIAISAGLLLAMNVFGRRRA